jgi:hypothetical protein
MLRLFFIVVDCDWEEKKLTNVRLPALTTEMKNILDKPVSVRAIQLSNLFQTIFDEVPNNEIDQLNPLFSHMLMTYFDKKFATLKRVPPLYCHVEIEWSVCPSQLEFLV